jgi:hypothetical protein
MPDFIDKYSIHATQDLRNSGKPPAQIEQEIQEMNRMMTLYKNNFLVNIAFTLLEPLPVGLVMTFISALILRRGRKDLQDGQDEVKGNPVNQVNPV